MGAKGGWHIIGLLFQDTPSLLETPLGRRPNSLLFEETEFDPIICREVQGTILFMLRLQSLESVAHMHEYIYFRYTLCEGTTVY